ncbi:Uncharacterised protein [Segatella copri]|nr:Uncharacterised protein [Segatella copri]
MLPIISVNATLSTYPHGTILCLDNRINSRAGKTIVCIEIGKHEHISGNMRICLKSRCQQQQYN